MDKKFFVIEVERMIDVAEHPNDHWFVIQTEPGRLNMSGEPCESGWPGTTNDWRREAHGAFASVDSARATIRELTDGRTYLWEDHEGTPDPDVVEVWSASKFPIMDRESVSLDIGDGDWSEITAETPDDELAAMAAGYIRLIEAEMGATADIDHVIDELTSIRDARRDGDE